MTVQRPGPLAVARRKNNPQGFITLWARAGEVVGHCSRGSKRQIPIFLLLLPPYILAVSTLIRLNVFEPASLIADAVEVLTRPASVQLQEPAGFKVANFLDRFAEVVILQKLAKLTAEHGIVKN
jgi:hypothetical protein